MRLLLVSDSYPPFIGGADADTEALARAMARAGHRVIVATPWQPGLAEREVDEVGVEIRRLRPLSTRTPWFARDAARRHHPPFPDPGTVIGLRRLVREAGPDLVHTYGWITASVAVSLLGTHIPILVSARDYGQICAIRTLAYHRGGICTGPGLLKCLACAGRTYTADEAGASVLGGPMPRTTARQRLRGAGKALAAVISVVLGRPWLARRVAGLHAVSTFVEAMMVREFLGPEQVRSPDLDGRPFVRTVPPFLRLGSDGASPGLVDAAILDRLPSDPFILFVGSLLPQKGVWPLLAAYAALRDPPPLVLMGPVHHNSPRQFPPGVTVLDSVPHATVMAAWDRALFGVVPSVGAETFGNVAIEAMAHGKAVVASAVGGLLDIVEDGVTGLLVPPGDVPALASAMERLIADADLRGSLGDAARVHVQRFREAVVLPRYEALYVAVLDRGRAAARRHGTCGGSGRRE